LWGERPNQITLHGAKFSLFLSCVYAGILSQTPLKLPQIYPILCAIGLIWVLLKNILGSFNFFFLPEGIIRLFTNYVPSSAPNSKPSDVDVPKAEKPPQQQPVVPKQQQQLQDKKGQKKRN